MTHRTTPTPHGSEAGRYEIRLTGHLDAHWTAWFDGLAVSHQSDGTTVISGPSPTRPRSTACSSGYVTSACR